MLLNIPQPGDFIVIEDTIISPGGGRWEIGPNHSHLTDVQAVCAAHVSEQPDAMWYKYNMYAGEWYRIKSIWAPPTFMRSTVGDLMITLSLDKKFSERKWVKQKLEALIVKTNLQVIRVRPTELNGKVEVVKSMAEAIYLSDKILGKDKIVPKEENNARFRRLMR